MDYAPLGLNNGGETFPTQGVATVLLISLFQSFLWLNLITLICLLLMACLPVVCCPINHYFLLPLQSKK
jgi:hypothetical protein